MDHPIIRALAPFLLKAKPYIPAGSFTAGFTFDLVTLGRIDDKLNFISQTMYLGIVGSILLLSLEAKSAWLWTGPSAKRKAAKLFLTYERPAFHFLLGALLSAFAIFYFKSSSLGSSFFFLALLASVLVLNELRPLQKLGPIFRTALFQLALISYTTYLLPTLMGQINTPIFALSIGVGLLSSMAMAAWLWVRHYPMGLLVKNYAAPTALVYALFVTLYVTNTLPPIPLSLQKIGIYHNVLPQAGAYELSQQTPPWKFWSRGDETFQARKGDKIFVFARVFAPINFNDKIYLRWQKRGPTNKWLTTDRIPLSIVGGRELGFRGYAYKANYAPGEWRVSVETERSSEIGRITFDVYNDLSTEPRKWHLTYE